MENITKYEYITHHGDILLIKDSFHLAWTILLKIDILLIMEEFYSLWTLFTNDEQFYSK